MLFKLACIVAFSFIGGASADSYLSNFLQPSRTLVNSVCDDGYTLATDPSLSSDKRTSMLRNIYSLYSSRIDSGFGDGVYIQSPLGTAFSDCYTAGTDLMDKPSYETLKAESYVLVTVNGRASDLSIPRNWKSVISVVDNSGKEIVRATPSKTQAGDEDHWKVDCGNGCVWYGSNTYFFETASLMGSNPSALKILVSRGKGIESFSVDSKSQPDIK